MEYPQKQNIVGLSNITIRSRIAAYFVSNIMHLFVKLTDYYQRIILLILAGLL